MISHTISKYDFSNHKWKILSDLKVIWLVLGLQISDTKHCFSLCYWDSRVRNNHCVVRQAFRTLGFDRIHAGQLQDSRVQHDVQTMFLAFSFGSFSPNLRAVSDEHVKWFNENIAAKKKLYKKPFADYCWTLTQKVSSSTHKRKVFRHSF